MPPTRRRPVVRAGTLLVVLAGLALATGSLLTLSLARPAAAHTTLELIVPTPGAVVQAPPSELVLRFSQPIEQDFVRIRLTGPDGAELAMGMPTMRDSELRHPLPTLTVAGHYRGSFQVVAPDGHLVIGTFSFTLPSDVLPAAPAPAPDPAPGQAVDPAPDSAPDPPPDWGADPGSDLGRSLGVPLVGVLGAGAALAGLQRLLHRDRRDGTAQGASNSRINAGHCSSVGSGASRERKSIGPTCQAANTSAKSPEPVA
jgi:copper resistance protein C